MNLVAVIMAGGVGTRFWPLSRENKPKQLLNLSGRNIMLNDTILRYESLIPLENNIIVTNETLGDALNRVLLDKVPRENILKEPLSKNTAACILYAALFAKKKYGDSLMVVIPSDHYITDNESFRKVLQKTCEIAKDTEQLVTVGIKPAFPSTGYGYIKFNQAYYNNISNVYSVSEFVEKPNFEKAKHFLESGDYLWNSGIFIWKTSIILENFQRYLPRLYNSMYTIYEHLGTEMERELLAKIYPDLPNISIDYGILERSEDVLVVPGDFGWSDIGSWDVLGAIFPPDNNGNIIKAKHVGINTLNTIIYGGDRLIATIAIDNLIIAETDDAILICPRDQAQRVKEIVDLLKEEGMSEFI